MMAQDRMNALEAYLSEDEARAQKLGTMSAAEAAKAINADGYDFTADELVEFANSIPQENSGELDEAALEGVSGGSWKSFWRGFIAGWRSC